MFSEEELKKWKEEIKQERIEAQGEISQFIAGASLLFLIDKILKQQKEIEILENLFEEIREITRKYIICIDSENKNILRPVKNATKQDIYKAFNDIKFKLKGEYIFKSSEEVIKELLGEEE